METIGIITAMTQESDAMLRLVEQRECTNLGSFRCYRFRLSDRDCWLILSGMGIQRAAQATQALLAATRPQLLVSLGIAGAVNEDLEIGDVVAARNTCQLDKGVLGPLQSLACLSDAALQSAARALEPGGASLYYGTAVTTHGSLITQPQPEGMSNPVLEMETAGIIGVAREEGIPLLSVRAISDGPQAPIPFDLEGMMDEEYNVRTGQILQTILRHPRMVPQLLRMGRNTRKAADNAAIALVAALRQPGSVITK
jgi:adenosylhomocysteine nucleosidase